MIANFAQAQIDRGRLVRVMNSVEDGDKIRVYRERLAQVKNRFEVSVCHVLDSVGSNTISGFCKPPILRDSQIIEQYDRGFQESSVRAGFHASGVQGRRIQPFSFYGAFRRESRRTGGTGPRAAKKLCGRPGGGKTGGEK